MAYNELDLNIDLGNITKVIGDVDKFADAVQRGIELGIKDLSDRMKDKLIENMTLYGLATSPLMNKISVDPSSNGIKISIGDYGMYVEFGTGIVGASNPHPHPWIYDVNGHGEKGWFYPTDASDPNPWKHYYNGKLYAWTKGQKARPFMYNTWLWGTRSATQIIRKNIRNQIKMIGR